MTEYTNYAQFNQFTATGRISHAEVVPMESGEFLSVSIITTLMKDGPEVEITFTNSNGLLALNKKGYFGKGREVTITGHVASVEQTYLDKKSGQTMMKKRPEIHLIGANVPEGGLGRMPKQSVETATTAAGTVVSAG